jgi:hypothetical protein
MRLATLLAAIMFCAEAAASEEGCGFDLAAVREAALAAGPARSVEHFTAYDGSVGRSSTIVIDLVRPDRMRRISIFEDGKVGHMVLIAGSGWSGNIEGNWEPLDATFSAKMLEAVMKNSPWPDIAAPRPARMAGRSPGSASPRSRATRRLHMKCWSIRRRSFRSATTPADRSKTGLTPKATGRSVSSAPSQSKRLTDAWILCRNRMMP